MDLGVRCECVDLIEQKELQGRTTGRYLCFRHVVEKRRMEEKGPRATKRGSPAEETYILQPMCKGVLHQIQKLLFMRIVTVMGDE